MTEYRLPLGTARKLEMLGMAAGMECVVSFLDALEQYAEDGTLPEDLHPYVSVLLADVLPINEKARNKSNAGRLGGSKPEANSKQAASRSEANAKQTLSKSEANDKQEREDEEERREASPTPPTEREGEVEERDIYTPSVDISDDISPYGVCAEPKPSAPAPIPEPPVITFPLNDGTEFAVTQEYYAQLAELYPLPDTMQTLRNIRGWCLDNPKSRKTKSGAKRFVNAWFAREQDRGKRPASSDNRPHRPTPEEAYALPAINPWSITGGDSS